MNFSAKHMPSATLNQTPITNLYKTLKSPKT